MKKVLVVDDEHELIASIKFFLHAFKENMLYAYSGNEALQILDQEDDVGLIISDFSMSNGNGLKILEHVRNVNRPVDFYFFSSLDLSNLDLNGCNGIFSKPENIMAMLDLVKSYCIQESA